MKNPLRLVQEWTKADLYRTNRLVKMQEIIMRITSKISKLNKRKKCSTVSGAFKYCLMSKAMFD